MAEAAVVVAKPGVGGQAAAAQAADKGDTGQQKDTGKAADDIAHVNVPLRVVTALKDELKQAKAQSKQYADQLAAFNQQRNQDTEPPKKQESHKDPLDGLDDSDIVTVADVKKILKQTSGKSGALTSRLEHLQFAVEHPDYKEAIGNLGKALKNDPELAEQIHSEIKNSANPLATAYNYAKLISRTPGQGKAGKGELDIMDELETILANQNKPGSPAQVQGGGGGVSRAEKIKAMTPKEFEQHLSRIKNG